MKYFSFKLKTTRICAVAVSLCLLFGLLCLTGSMNALGESVFYARSAKDGNTEEKRQSFILNYGWEILDEPYMTKEVTVPESFDAVYTRYNEEIQLPQGYDLRKYAGKRATLYVYEIINYPTEDEVYANLLVCDGRIIGGDICSYRLDGFMHGFAPPENIRLPDSSQLYD